MKGGDDPLAALIAAPGGRRGAEISRVDDPAALLSGAPGALHGDVIDALVDLAVALIDKDAPTGRAQGGSEDKTQ